jgi:hypothetical protein
MFMEKIKIIKDTCFVCVDACTLILYFHTLLAEKCSLKKRVEGQSAFYCSLVGSRLR